MSETKECMECGATETSRFRSLTGNKWKEAKAYDLLKVTWKKNNYLCHSCYMNCVENQLRRLKREAKRPKVSVEEAVTNVDVAEDDDVIEVDIDDIIKEEIENKIKEGVELRDIETIMREDIEAVDEEEVSMINLVEVVGSMARIFYERKHTRKEGPIYLFDEMRELLPQIDPSLKNFFDQLYLLAWPFEHCEQTMGRMKRLMVQATRV
ncbi:hypothetical protein C2G38_2194102 [Gigaspora rosea]|uniref:Uncharacterized protein n=1 Tax=Gigaspora rosea TaxID=44941 RepID=A0A397V170_9GLOM|nr:hypothetical protein C2G38_2194102 [Gigaspora rosea]